MLFLYVYSTTHAFLIHVNTNVDIYLYDVIYNYFDIMLICNGKNIFR